MMTDTPLFAPQPGDSRLTTLPIGRPEIFKFYVDSTDCYWTVKEISNFSVDASDYSHKLNPAMRHFVKMILAFFSASDGIVTINLAERFQKEINILEVKYFYDYQIMIENVHAHTYSLLIEEIIPSAKERAELFDSVKSMPIIKKMADYMYATINSRDKFAVRLLKMACVEGLFFTGCFCVIYWLQMQGLMPALGHSNELIARDEGLHAEFALYLYTILQDAHKLTTAEIHAIFTDAVQLAHGFIAEILPENLSEMNAKLMFEYIKAQADILLSMIEVPKLYGAKHNFHFMDQINLKNFTHIFERKVTEYSRATSTDNDASVINWKF